MVGRGRGLVREVAAWSVRLSPNDDGGPGPETGPAVVVRWSSGRCARPDDPSDHAQRPTGSHEPHVTDPGSSPWVHHWAV